MTSILSFTITPLEMPKVAANGISFSGGVKVSETRSTWCFVVKQHATGFLAFPVKPFIKSLEIVAVRLRL